MKPFKDRLKAVMRGGNLTVTDLAQWFDAKRPTVNYWLSGVTPMQNKQDLLSQRLAQLEVWVKHKCGLPVPLSTLRHERKTYIAGLKSSADHPISKSDSSPKRNKTVVGEAR